MGKVADLSVFTPGGQPGAPNPSEGLAVLRQNQTAFMETIGVMPPEALTIADGAISPTTAVCIVDTEGGAPADDLTTINATLSDGGTLHDGMVILLSAKDASRVVTVKNSDAPNGVKTVDGKDIALSPEWSLVLQYASGGWQQISVSAPLKPATETMLGGVKVGDGLTMGEDGTLSADLATAEAPGRVKASETAMAGAVPVADENGQLDVSWLAPFNSRLVITESNAVWTPPVTGWARVVVIGGGGGGGKGGSQITGGGGLGGGAGGQTSFGDIVAAGGGGGGGGGATGGADVGGSGGGGASGAVNIQYIYLVSDTPISVVIGAGGAGATATTGTSSGGDGGGSLGGKGAATSYGPGGGGGVIGGGNGGNAGSYAPFSSAGYITMPGAAGNGGSNGTGYGGGGGGGSGDVSGNNPTVFLSGIGGDNGSPGGDPNDANGGNGGDGGQGAVIIEYYDPAKEDHNA